MSENNLTIRILWISTVTAAFFLTGCPKTKEQAAMNNLQTSPSSLENDPNRSVEKAIFAAGCFWHVEHAFGNVPGVISTAVGYIGGTTENPTYKMVCSDTTGHAEAVQVTYDPQQVTYEQLLDVFWKIHDPTQLNRQGPDVGTQYRSAIFYYTSEQRRVALDSKAKLEKSGKFSEPIVTEIFPAGDFYHAEEYHQQYFKKHGFICSP
jgi:peptide-methionine (S)-S-oxide reductase